MKVFEVSVSPTGQAIAERNIPRDDAIKRAVMNNYSGIIKTERKGKQYAYGMWQDPNTGLVMMQEDECTSKLTIDKLIGYVQTRRFR